MAVDVGDSAAMSALALDACDWAFILAALDDRDASLFPRFRFGPFDTEVQP